MATFFAKKAKTSACDARLEDFMQKLEASANAAAGERLLYDRQHIARMTDRERNELLAAWEAVRALVHGT